MQTPKRKVGMRHTIVALAAVVLTLSSVAVVTQRVAQASDQVDEAPVSLLPGYLHRAHTGAIDSIGGRIWKPSGPSIEHVIGRFAANEALTYADRIPKAIVLRLATRSPVPERVIVTMDLDHDSMVVSIGEMTTANFIAANVRSRRDVAEVMAMIQTYRIR